MRKNKDKGFAIWLFVKPQDEQDTGGLIRKYKGRSYKGFAVADNEQTAGEKTISMLLEAFKDSKTKITRTEITIRECKLYNDFFVK